MTDKICKDCKHYRLNGSQPPGSQHRCNRPLLDLVTGQSWPHDTICAAERSDGSGGKIGICGLEGRFWEPRT